MGEQWRRCRDAYDGVDAVKGKGQKYLPAWGSDEQRYIEFLCRAHFYPAMARSVEAHTGMIFRKLPTLSNVPEAMKSDLTDIDLRGNTLVGASVDTVRELLITGRQVIALDAADGRVFWRFYRAEDVEQYWVSSEAPYRVQYVMFREEYQEPTFDGARITLTDAVRYRVLRINAGVVEVLVGDGKEFTRAATLGRSSGEALTDIPVMFLNAYGVGVEPGKPPMLDMVDTNFAHYRTSADLDHALHWSALPTPWIAGGKAGVEGTFRIGSDVAWSLPEGSKADMLEPSGNGLSGMEKRLGTLATEMAALGARLITEPFRGSEATEAVRIKSGGDGGALSSIVATVDQAYTQLLRWHADWAGYDGEPSITLNRDFYDIKLSPQHITALMALVQAGVLSQETFYEQLHTGELTNPNRTFEEEKALIAAETPPPQPQPTNVPGAGTPTPTQGE